MSLPLRSPRFTTPPTSARFQQAANNTPTIKKGENNTQAVRLIQQALIDLGIPLPISTKQYDSPDGDFGNETHEAVKFFQRKYLPGETPDGKVGKNTLSKLDDLLPLAGAAAAGAGRSRRPGRSRQGCGDSRPRRRIR